MYRIINLRNWQRLDTMLSSSQGQTVIGGERDEKDLYIAPTVVTGVSTQDSLMREEIFGPILPIVSVTDVEEAVKIINSRDKPLRSRECDGPEQLTITQPFCQSVRVHQHQGRR